MKRILTAALLAMGIHGLLLGVECNRLKRISIERPNPRVMTMTLTMRQPQVPTSKPAVKKPQIPKKKPVFVKKVEKKPKPFPKPKLKKMVKADVQPTEKELSKEIPEKPFDESKTPIEPEQTFFKESAKKVISVPTQRIAREARPLYLINPTPKYPKIARKRGYQGTVVLEVLVDRNGKVGSLKVLESSGYKILDRAAKSSVKNWLFEPGIIKNDKVEMWVRVPIRFELK